MKQLPSTHRTSIAFLRVTALVVWQRAAGRLALIVGRLSWPPTAGQNRKILMWLLLLVGIVCQAVALVWLGILVDLSIDLAELWLELARKHLELTL